MTTTVDSGPSTARVAAVQAPSAGSARVTTSNSELRYSSVTVSAARSP